MGLLTIGVIKGNTGSLDYSSLEHRAHVGVDKRGSHEKHSHPTTCWFCCFLVGLGSIGAGGIDPCSSPDRTSKVQYVSPKPLT